MDKISESPDSSTQPEKIRAARFRIEAAIEAADLCPDDEQLLRQLIAAGGFDPTTEHGF